MKSKASNHFPQIKTHDNEPLLFNPILKKRFKNRPEERVRLKWVEYLNHQTDWPKSRLGFEAPVKLQQEKNNLRADLILYSRQMKPEILIECKAESVKLTNAVGEQAARYNQEVGAPYICLTNGITDFWYKVSNNSVSAIEASSGPDFPIKPTKKFSELNRDFNYWQDRGFCAGNFTATDKEMLYKSITHFWSDSIDWQKTYLDFSSSPFEFGLQQYYRIPVIDNNQKLAISFIANPAGSTHLVAILNKKGQNHALLSIHLNRLSEGHSDSAILFHSGEMKQINAGKHFTFFKHGFSKKLIGQLPLYLMRFFV
ncbi:MAG: type I restriction enzyme HsdR N-terminal domain-containing protein [Rhodohalobacter sp.]|uniref:type I restriction enzyme HsdR N-terminal domain-containing protein n=1 Tax=Rhodohalobacter sp. TaxID=1974210 RepID=UPI003976097B